MLCFRKIYYRCSTLKYGQFNSRILQVDEEYYHSSKESSQGEKWYGPKIVPPAKCCPDINAKILKYYKKKTQHKNAGHKHLETLLNEPT